jgi:hypothetical protein
VDGALRCLPLPRAWSCECWSRLRLATYALLDSAVVIVGVDARTAEQVDANLDQYAKQGPPTLWTDLVGDVLIPVNPLIKETP